METKFDQRRINGGGLPSGSARSTPASPTEARRKPGLTARIPIEFVIGNDGRVKKVWVDHPPSTRGDLRECLLKRAAEVAFQARTRGERRRWG